MHMFPELRSMLTVAYGTPQNLSLFMHKADEQTYLNHSINLNICALQKIKFSVPGDHLLVFLSCVQYFPFTIRSRCYSVGDVLS